MAIIKAIGGGQNLRRILSYVLHPSKTSAELTDGWNVDPENAYAEMIATKRQWRKTGGRAYKHFTQAFAPNDGITPEEALGIAAELVERSPMFRDFEVVYAVHVDRDHIHTHIVCNTVNIRDGKKFRYGKPALQELKDLSDEIVKSHGYRLAHERPETDTVTAWDTNEYQVIARAHAGKRKSWEYDLAITVQDVMQQTADKDGFIQEMEARGYSVRWGDRSITYTTPDGRKRRASLLESYFKLPSIREMYADRDTEQEQLRADLASTPDTPTEAAYNADPPISPIDYNLYNLDLRCPPNWMSPGRTRAQRRYETACAVCRQLRGAASASDFNLGMEIGGYQVDYDYLARDYIFRHPSGTAFYGAELESTYHLPPLRTSVDYLIMRPYVPPGYDGLIAAKRAMRQTDLDVVCEALGIKRPGAVWKTADIEAAMEADWTEFEDAEVWTLPDSSPSARQNTIAQMDMYVHPNSSIWNDEMRAAALVLGQAICEPEDLASHLAEHGYALRKDEQVTYLRTPRGRKIILVESSPEPEPERKSPVKIGSVTVLAGNYMCGCIGRRSRSTAEEIIRLTAGVILGAAALIETAARLIGRGFHVMRRRHKGKKDDYEIISDNASVLLSQAFRRAGITPQFPIKIPIAEEDRSDEQEIRNAETAGQKYAAPEQSAVSAQEQPEAVRAKQPASESDDLQELLRIIKNASVATDRESFEDLLKEQNCRTRWTENGTLTFILPGDKHIRASRLEKKYNLPSISAAYGQERKAPTRGIRYEASEAVRSAAATASDQTEFDTALEAQGYAIRWKPGNEDAMIIAPGGQRMSLSSLEQTFGMQILQEAPGGVQHQKERKSKSGDDGQSLDEFRRAVAAAKESVDNGAADPKDTRPGKSSQAARRTHSTTRKRVGGDGDQTRHGNADTAGRAGHGQRARRWDDLDR